MAKSGTYMVQVLSKGIPTAVLALGPAVSLCAPAGAALSAKPANITSTDLLRDSSLSGFVEVPPPIPSGGSSYGLSLVDSPTVFGNADGGLGMLNGLPSLPQSSGGKPPVHSRAVSIGASACSVRNVHGGF